MSAVPEEEEKKEVAATASGSAEKKSVRVRKSVGSMAAGPSITLYLSGASSKLERVMFVCAAQLREEVIDLHTDSRDECTLKYCCGLRMPVDRSHTVETLLSAEWLDSLSMDTGVKRIAVWVHGYNWTSSGATTAANSILDASLELCRVVARESYLVIPFLWPSEGMLLASDEGYGTLISKQTVALELAKFIERAARQLRTPVDVLAHGVGCDVALTAVEHVVRGKRRVLMAGSRVICVAPDMTVSAFRSAARTMKADCALTVYVNTWDWHMTWLKWTRWSEDRAGHTLDVASVAETVDVTDLVSDWKSTGHFYTTHPLLLADLRGALVRDAEDRATLTLVEDGGYWKLEGFEATQRDAAVLPR